MNKHTQGPWNICYGGTSSDDGFSIESRIAAEIICERWPRTVAIDDRHRMAADARLIAAAPELLAAMAEIVSQIDQGGESGKVFARDCCIQAARAAIAKAKGVSPQ